MVVIHSLNKHLLNIYYIPRAGLGTGDTTGSKEDTVPILLEVHLGLVSPSLGCTLESAGELQGKPQHQSLVLRGPDLRDVGGPGMGTSNTFPK